MIRVYVVFKYVLPWRRDAVIDTIWRNMPAAYERMESLKEGGYIEIHEVQKA